MTVVSQEENFGLKGLFRPQSLFCIASYTLLNSACKFEWSRGSPTA